VHSTLGERIQALLPLTVSGLAVSLVAISILKWPAWSWRRRSANVGSCRIFFLRISIIYGLAIHLTGGRGHHLISASLRCCFIQIVAGSGERQFLRTKVAISIFSIICTKSKLCCILFTRVAKRRCSRPVGLSERDRSRSGHHIAAETLARRSIRAQW